MAEIPTRRVILVGKTGSGKSSTGNSILGEELFGTKKGFTSMTQTCEKYTGFRSSFWRKYTVVDTPGLFDTDQPFAVRALEIQRSLEICPKPHAFLIVLNPERYTEEEKLTIDMLRVIFGEGFLKHAILVFTRGTEYKSDQALNDAIEESETINNLRNECGNRVARVDNNPQIDTIAREELVRNVLYMIEQVSNGGTIFYLYRSWVVHRICLQQHLKSRKPNAEVGEELKELVEKLGRQLVKERWRSYLIGGIAGVGGATAAVGLMYTAPLAAAAAAAPGAIGTVQAAMGAAATFTTSAVASAGPYVYQGAATVLGAGASLFGGLARLRFT